MPARRLLFWSGITTVVCLIGSSSCRSQEQTISDGEESEHGEEWEREGGALPVLGAGATDGDTLRHWYPVSLGAGVGDDVRISTAITSPISENSIAVHPLDRNIVLCANNLTPSRRQNDVVVGWSLDGGATWTTRIVAAAKGDPASAIDRDGTFYVSYLTDRWGVGLSVSTDNGATWLTRSAYEAGLATGADKDHLVVDTGAASPFVGRLYAAWAMHDTWCSSSGDGGRSWSIPRNVSRDRDHLPIGANLQTGPGGELYCCWTVRAPFAAEERAIGFNSSLDGGNSFLGRRTAFEVRGTWATGIPNTPIQTNSMPAMAVDKSGGPRNGWINIFWTNRGVPGGSVGDADVYVARSRDGGFSWDPPVRINDDATTNTQWQVWGTCDQANGDLYSVFLDRREDPADVLARPWVARSRDGGETWLNLPVGDVQFTPMGFGPASYMGHYIGIAAQSGRVYPLWSDWRTGTLTAYTSPLTFDIAAPLVLCPEPVMIEGSASGGAAASDPAIAAFLAGVSATDETDPEPAITSDAPAFFPLGTTLVTFTATDDGGNVTRCSTPLMVVDTTAPDFTPSLSTDVLAPADHRLVPIDVSAVVADVVDPDAGFVLVSIGSSEADSGRGPDDLAKDIQDAQLGTPDTRFLLRAENYSRGSGRVYTIKYAARDASGNVRPRALSVRVQP